MKKADMFKALQDAEVEGLKASEEEYTAKELKTLYDENIKESPEENSTSFKPLPKLEFTESGWCPELGRSYAKGKYRPANQEEYDALKGYAKNEK
tara:strand:+ start:230 stop:514 length:285 start_codon:yes stop_codon:yes gene_type:complete